MGTYLPTRLRPGLNTGPAVREFRPISLPMRYRRWGHDDAKANLGSVIWLGWGHGGCRARSPGPAGSCQVSCLERSGGCRSRVGPGRGRTQLVDAPPRFDRDGGVAHPDLGGHRRGNTPGHVLVGAPAPPGDPVQRTRGGRCPGTQPAYPDTARGPTATCGRGRRFLSPDRSGDGVHGRSGGNPDVVDDPALLLGGRACTVLGDRPGRPHGSSSALLALPGHARSPKRCCPPPPVSHSTGSSRQTCTA